ncbi:MAG: hypothetical protein ABFC94_13495 [Syntrophomonas sp.]
MKKVSLGLILLLMLSALGGCQAGGMEKDVVFSQEQKSADKIENTGHFAASVQQAEAVEKAEAAFRQYFNIQNIDKNLVLKAALIEDDGILWMNPYWKLSWVGKDAKKPVYSAEIDAQSGEVVQLRYRPNWGHKNISKEDVLAYQDTALAFIEKYALVKEAPLSIFEASSSYMEGIFVEFRYGIDKFIMLYFNEAGDVAGFKFSQQVAYTLQGNDLKINRAEAIEMAKASIKQYYGEVATSEMIEQVRFFEGDKGEKTWFVSWKNIAPLEGRFIRYGAQIDALSGKVHAIEGTNHSIYNTKPEINAEKMRKIADRFLQQKNLLDYRFEAFDKDLGSLRYRDKAGSPLHVFVDRTNGNVSFISFIDSN